MRRGLFRTAAVGLLAFACLMLAPTSSATAAPASGTVTVVHGVPGLTVDVYVNGALTLPGFLPRTITAPLTLPAGTYDVVIVPAGGDPASPAIAGSATLAAGANVSLVAHLGADGTPTLSAFADDLSGTGAWRSRLSVRHTAAAPAVDVRLARLFAGFAWPAGVLSSLTNGEQASVRVWSGLFSARVTPAGVCDVTVLGPARLSLRPRTLTVVYAIGSLADGTLDLLVHVQPTAR